MCHHEIPVKPYPSLCGLKSGNMSCQDCVIWDLFWETSASSKGYQASAFFFLQHETPGEFQCLRSHCSSRMMGKGWDTGVCLECSHSCQGPLHVHCLFHSRDYNACAGGYIVSKLAFLRGSTLL